MKLYSGNILVKTSRQYYSLVLLITQYKSFLKFVHVDQLLQCDHSVINF